MDDSTKDKYWLVRVDFLDHATGEVSEGVGVSRDVAWGIIVYEDDQEIHLVSWASASNLKDAQTMVSVLVKHPLMKITRIREETL